MNRNPLRELTALRQSVWLDDIRRRWLVDGTPVLHVKNKLAKGLGIHSLRYRPPALNRHRRV